MASKTAHRVVREAIANALREPLALAAMPPGELDFTLRATRRAQVLAAIAWHLRESGKLHALDETARDALAGALAITESRARVALWELNRIAWALADAPPVALIALKGCAYLLAGLPNSRGRFFADVDLLVPEESLPAIESELRERGWETTEITPYDENYYRVWTHELPPLKHVERRVEIDLHHNVQMRTSRLRPDARLLLANARRVPGSRFSVLAPIDMTLHAMTHLLYGGEMDDAVREIFDIDQLLRHFGAHEPRFWEELWARAVQLDLARPAFYGLRYAARLLATPVPSQVLRQSCEGAPPRPIVWLMDRLVPRALFPQHPERQQGLVTATARLMLFMRTHWVRMPPLMLLRHLAYKFYVRNLQRRRPDNIQDGAPAPDGARHL